jgi:hypothetical protein
VSLRTLRKERSSSTQRARKADLGLWLLGRHRIMAGCWES